MTDAFPRIVTLGDSALTIELGNEISDAANIRALELFDHFSTHRFPGFIEAAPAYSSLTIFYDVNEVRRACGDYPSAFSAVKALAEIALRVPYEYLEKDTRAVFEIPVYFNEETGSDLGAVSEFSGLSIKQIVEIFTARTYRVFMLGFLPGFAYMGTVDERIAIPRRSTPRLNVPRGSVGIAGAQTGVYPVTSPGGWQIIGRTTHELFTPDDNTPCLLSPGDLVKFYEVERI